MTEKPEPLKKLVWKPVRDEDGWHWEDENGIRFPMSQTEEAIFERIDQLLQEIEEKRKNARSYQYDEWLDFYMGYEEALLDVEQLIKKAFGLIE